MLPRSGNSRGLQADGQDHHVKGLFRHLTIFSHKNKAKISGLGIIIDGMDPGLDKTNAFALLCPQVVFLVILTIGTNIHIKNSAIQITAGVLLGNHGILDSIHAAHR